MRVELSSGFSERELREMPEEQFRAVIAHQARQLDPLGLEPLDVFTRAQRNILRALREAGFSAAEVAEYAVDRGMIGGAAR